MNGQRVLAAEFAVSVSILGWGAVKQGFWPWPASVARSAFAFAVLSLIGLFDDRIAAVLGAGFLLAQVLRAPVDAQGNFKFTGGVPQGLAYGLLAVPGAASKDKSVPVRPEQSWTPGGAKLPSLQPTTATKPNGTNGVWT